MPYKDVFFLSKCSVKPVLTFFPLDPQPHHPLNKMMPSKHTDCFAGWSGERLWTLWDGLWHALSSGKAWRPHSRPLPGPALPKSPSGWAQPASSRSLWRAGRCGRPRASRVSQLCIAVCWSGGLIWLLEATVFFFFFSFIHCYFYFLTLLGALGLHCCAQAFSSCSAKGRLSGMAHRPPTTAAPLVVDHRLQVHGLQWLQLAGLIALRHVGSFQTPEKIEPHPLHWQANSFPLYIREVPSSYCFLLSKRAITISTPQITVMVKKLS